jgi:hypothetical protein
MQAYARLPSGRELLEREGEGGSLVEAPDLHSVHDLAKKLGAIIRAERGIARIYVDSPATAKLLTEEVKKMLAGARPRLAVVYYDYEATFDAPSVDLVVFSRDWEKFVQSTLYEPLAFKRHNLVGSRQYPRLRAVALVATHFDIKEIERYAADALEFPDTPQNRLVLAKFIQELQGDFKWEEVKQQLSQLPLERPDSRDPVVLLNAISISMVPEGGTIEIRPISLEEVKRLVQGGFQSYIGHPSTAQLLTTLLGVEVPVNRAMFVATAPTTAVVVSLLERLPEGKVLGPEEMQKLYEAGKVRFYLVVFRPG